MSWYTDPMTTTPTVQAAIEAGFARHGLSPVSYEASAYEQGYLDALVAVPTSLWKVVANVAGTNPDGWNTSHQIPTFYVEAISEENAKSIAEDIILSLDSADGSFEMHIDAVRAVQR